MKATRHKPAPGTLDDDLRRRQQRRHLLSLYLAACDYYHQLEGALQEGKSPTGFGSPLTPLSRESAEAVLAPLRHYLTELREFVREHAPEELAAHEQVQPLSNTAVWGSNLLERLRQITEELAPDRLRRYGETALPLPQLETLRRNLTEQVAQARRELRLP